MSASTEDLLSAPGPTSLATSPPGTRRMLPTLGLASFALYATASASWTVLVPRQLADLDAAHKVTNLAIANTVALVCIVLATPVFGAFSDRTRSRLGRRAPWLLGGALATTACLFALAGAKNLAWLVVLFTIFQVTLTTAQAALTTTIPDRFPAARRGVPSAFLGFGTLLGAGVGTVAAGQMANHLGTAYPVFGTAVLVTTVLFVLVNRDDSSRDQRRETVSVGTFVKSLWVSPRRHPDFAWAFAARLVFYVGFFSYFAVQLYVLNDYVGMSLDAASKQVGVQSAASLPGMVIAIGLSGWLSDRLGRRKIFVYVASVVVVVSLLIPLLAPTVHGLLIASVINGIGFGLYLSCDTALLTQVLPGDGTNAAKDLSLLNLATMLPQSLGAIVAAGIISALGGYRGLFVFGMVFVAAAGFLLRPVRGVR